MPSTKVSSETAAPQCDDAMKERSERNKAVLSEGPLRYIKENKEKDDDN